MPTGDDKDVVFALDIGVYRTGANGQILTSTTAGWSRLTRGVADFASIQHTGTPTCGHFVNFPNGGKSSTNFCGRSIQKLAELIAEDYLAGRRIALGFEAPMWLPLEERHRANLNLFSPRFPAEQGREWYLQSGAAASLKAISLGIMLREHLHELIGNTKTTTLFEYWKPGTVLMFEAFVAGKYKADDVTASLVAPNEWDAFIAGLAWGNLHIGFVTPPAYRGVCLHAAGARSGSCLSVWDMIFGAGTLRVSGRPDCEVVAFEKQSD